MREGRAPLLLDDYTLRIRDLASKSGTFVNGRVGAGDTILLQVDMVSIGEMTFLIDFNQSPRDETAVRTAALACDRKTGIYEGNTEQANVEPSPPFIQRRSLLLSRLPFRLPQMPCDPSSPVRDPTGPRKIRHWTVHEI